MWHFEERRYSVKWYEELPVRREASSHVSVSVWEGGRHSLWRCTGLHRGYNCTPFSMLYSESYEKKRKTSWQKQFWSFPCRFFLVVFACVCAFLTGKVVGELAGKKGDGTHYHASIRVEQSFESNSDDSCGIVCKLFQNCESKLIKTRPRSPDEAD